MAPARGQQVKEVMSGVECVLYNVLGYAEAAGVAKVQDGGQRAADYQS